MASRLGGVAGLQARRRMQETAARRGAEMAAERATHVKEQLERFSAHLQTFAREHRSEINRDPEFRRAFARMCRGIGVDPLASSKGFWSELLSVGDFYYELCVQIADVCLATRAENGGLIALSELTARVRRMRGYKPGDAAAHAATNVTEGDIRRALVQMSVLGGGIREVTLAAGGDARACARVRFVMSVPQELQDDHATVLRRCVADGRQAVSIPVLMSSHGWPSDRCASALRALLTAGMAWLDAPRGRMDDADAMYYFPAVVGALAAGSAAAPGGAAADDDDL